MDMTPLLFGLYKFVKYAVYPLSWIIGCFGLALLLAWLPWSARRQRWLRVALTTGTALLFLVVPRFFAELYTTDPTVIALVVILLPLAGIFQVFDGLQVVAVGILRGLGDTRAPMLINLVGFVVLGLGASLYLAYRTSLGAVGLWWGLVIGLAAVAIILLLRVRVALSRPLQRVRH